MSDYITSTNKLKIAELDFDAIKTALKTYLEGQSEFADYDFDSSALSILLDVLAYNTHYNGFYLNMLASEMFLDSATLRSSIVSLAKHLGYTPSSRRGSSVNLDVVGTTSPFTVPKNAKFTTKIGTQIYTFLATQAHAATYDESDQTYKATSIDVKEGVSNRVTYEVKGSPNEVFEIPNENVDSSSIAVAVGSEYYTRVDDITEITGSSKVYFLQEEGDLGKYQIYFGDGTIGVKPSVSDIITIDYNVSILGEEGNGATTFNLAESISGITTATVSLSSGFTRSFGGSERETTFSIREQAPRQFGLQKRVVTKNDYKTRLENDYNLVDSVRVWGGEENIPPEYGSVFICVKPKSGYVLSRAEEQRIGESILKRRNVVGVTPRFVEPDYMFIVPDITVSYDPRKTTRTQDQLKTLVRANILNYSSQNLSKFDQYFRYSALSRIIDDSEVAIQNNNMTINMKKRIRPIVGTTSDYRIYLDNPVYRPHEGHASVVNSTTFTYRGITNCKIVDRDGYLMVVRDEIDRPRGTSGIDYGNQTIAGYDEKLKVSIVNSRVGYMNYETGEMLIETLSLSKIDDGSDYIYFTVKPRIQDILPKQNTIITIEDADITISCIDDTDRIVEDKVRSY